MCTTGAHHQVLRGSAFVTFGPAAHELGPSILCFSEHALEETARHAGELSGMHDIAVRATQYFVQVISFKAYCGVGARLLQRSQRDFELLWLGPSGAWPSQARSLFVTSGGSARIAARCTRFSRFPDISGSGVRQQCFPGLRMKPVNHPADAEADLAKKCWASRVMSSPRSRSAGTETGTPKSDSSDRRETDLRHAFHEVIMSHTNRPYHQPARDPLPRSVRQFLLKDAEQPRLQQ